MPNPNIVEGDMLVRGTLVPTNLVPPAACITDSAIAAGANLAGSKLEHQHAETYRQSGTAAAAVAPLHMVRGLSGTILSVEAGSIAAAIGDSTVTIDVKKGGTTILSAPIVLDSGNTARVAEAGTLAVTSLADGNLLEVAITVSAGGGTLPTGLFVTVCWRERADP